MFTELIAVSAGGGSVLAVLALESSVVTARAWAARSLCWAFMFLLPSSKISVCEATKSPVCCVGRS